MPEEEESGSATLAELVEFLGVVGAGLGMRSFQKNTHSHAFFYKECTFSCVLLHSFWFHKKNVKEWCILF